MNHDDSEQNGFNHRPSQNAGYDAGHQGSKGSKLDLSCWAPPLQSQNLDIKQAGDLVPSRINNLIQNDGFIAGAAQRHDDNAIGTGLKLSMRVDEYALDADADWAREFNAHIEKSFRAWTRSSRNLPDRTGKHSWPSLQVMANRSLLHDVKSLRFMSHAQRETATVLSHFT